MAGSPVWRIKPEVQVLMTNQHPFGGTDTRTRDRTS